jgi:hypothetical protein
LFVPGATYFGGWDFTIYFVHILDPLLQLKGVEFDPLSLVMAENPLQSDHLESVTSASIKDLVATHDEEWEHLSKKQQ